MRPPRERFSGLVTILSCNNKITLGLVVSSLIVLLTDSTDVVSMGGGLDSPDGEGLITTFICFGHATLLPRRLRAWIPLLRVFRVPRKLFWSIEWVKINNWRKYWLTLFYTKNFSIKISLVWFLKIFSVDEKVKTKCSILFWWEFI